MNKRLLYLVLALVITIAGAWVYYRDQPVRIADAEVKAAAAARPGPYNAQSETEDIDPFDAPFESDPKLIAEYAHPTQPFPFKANDRVAWIGSSSTYIGIWSRALEFLLRSRHPELKLTFSRHSTGGGTYAVGASRLPDWMERSQPTMVFLNYGANDSFYGKPILPEVHAAMQKCDDITKRFGARVIHITPQSGDARKSQATFLNRRSHYTDDMITLCKANGWQIVDIFHPLLDLQKQAEAQDPDFSINSDIIHLTDSAYVAWGFFLYDRLNPADAVSSLEIDATAKKVTAALHCKAEIVDSPEILAFKRLDDVLPILPPNPLPPTNPYREAIVANSRFLKTDEAAHVSSDLPPRQFVPMEKHSQFLLKIIGLTGNYVLTCDGKLVGRASGKQFADGVNLNTLALDAGVSPPWDGLARKLWDGMQLSEIDGRTLKFEVKREDR